MHKNLIPLRINLEFRRKVQNGKTHFFANRLNAPIREGGNFIPFQVLTIAIKCESRLTYLKFERDNGEEWVVTTLPLGYWQPRKT